MGPPMVAPGPDEFRIATMLVPVITLLVISTSLMVTRVYSRLQPVVNLGWDDAAAVLAAVSPVARSNVPPARITDPNRSHRSSR